MLRRIVRSFRQLPVILPDSPRVQENLQIQLDAIKDLNEAEQISQAGGSQKAHALHASRNKVFGNCLISLLKSCLIVFYILEINFYWKVKAM